MEIKGKQFCKKCKKFYKESTQHKCCADYRYPPKENVEKPIFQCDKCEKTFMKRESLHSHVMSVHEKRLDFQCEHCPKKLPSLRRLKDHVGQAHKQNVICDICAKMMLNPIELKRHRVFVHKETKGAWLCEKCPKSVFFSQVTFDRHVKNKH